LDIYILTFVFLLIKIELDIYCNQIDIELGYLVTPPIILYYFHGQPPGAQCAGEIEI